MIKFPYSLPDYGELIINNDALSAKIEHRKKLVIALVFVIFRAQVVRFTK